MNSKNDELSKPLLILSSVIPPLGFILFFIYRKKSPKKAKKVVGSALIGIPIAFLMGNYIIPYLSELLFY